MALEATGSDTDRVVCGSNAVLDTIAQGTFLAWVYLDTVNATRVFFGKGGDGGPRLIHDVFGVLNVAVKRATTNQSAVGATLSTGAWQFVACTWDITNGGPKVYKGDLTTLATDGTTSPADGSGAQGDDSATNLTLMNYNEATPSALSIDGRMARAMLFDTDLSLAEIQALQRRFRNRANCVGLWLLGYNGTNSQIDYSGNGNNGTVTGATVAAGVPLGHFRERRGLLVPHLVAVSGDKTIAAVAMTATAQMPAASVRVDRTVGAAAMTATASSPSASLSISPNISAQAMQATAGSPNASLAIGPVIAAQPMLATAGSPNASLVLSSVILAQAMGATAGMPNAGLSVSPTLAAAVMAATALMYAGVPVKPTPGGIIALAGLYAPNIDLTGLYGPVIPLAGLST